MVRSFSQLGLVALLSTSACFARGGDQGSLALSTVTATPATLLADNNTIATIRIQLIDSDGDVVANAPVVLSSDGNNGVFVQPQTTDANGIAVGTVRSSAVGKQIIVATMQGSTPAEVPQVATITFMAGPASGLSSHFTAAPVAVVANGSSATQISLTLHDAYDHPIVGAAVTLSSSGSGNIFGKTTGVTDDNGAFATTLASTTAEQKTITITAGGVTLTAPATFSSGAANSSHSVLTADPNLVDADGVSLTDVLLTLNDDEGNPVAGAAVSFSSSGTNNVFSTTTSVTDSSGNASTTLRSTTIETKTITASGTGWSDSTNVIFQSGAPSSGNTTIAITPASVTADGTTAVTIKVTVRDAGGHPLVGEPVVLTASGTHNTYGPHGTSGSTDASGAFTTTLTSTLAQTETLTAISGAASVVGSVTFTVGSASTTHSTLTASRTTAIADNSNAITVTVTAVDNQNNPVAFQPVAFTYAFAAANGSTDATGVYSTTLVSKTVEGKVVTANVGAAAPTVAVTFIAGAPLQTHSSLTANPLSVVANNANTTLLTVVVADQFNNPVSNYPVSITSDGNANTFSLTSGNTNVAGVWTTTLKSTKAQAKNLTATVGSVSPFSETASVTFIPGPVATATSSVTVNPNTQQVGNTSVVITITAEDAFGNLISNQPVSFVGTGSINTYGAQSGNTVAATFTSVMHSTKAELKVLTATIGTVTENANVTFTPGPVDAGHSTFTVNPNTLVANNVAGALLTLTAQDQYANPIANDVVSVTDTGATDTFSAGLSGNTNVAGQWLSTMTSKTAEVKTLVANFGGAVSFTSNVTFVAGPPTKAQSSFSLTPTSGIVANNTNTTQVSITLRDQYSNLVPSYPVGFRAEDVQSPAYALFANTTTAGTYSFTMASRFAGPKTVEAVFNGTWLTAAVTFTQPTAYCTKAPTYGGALPVTVGPKSVADVALADMDGDSILDEVIADNGNMVVTIALGTGGGRYGTMASYSTLGLGPEDVAVCNFNGDGRPDVISHNRTSGTLAVFLGQAGGTLGTATMLSVTGTDTGRQGIACVDVNNDGKQDIIDAYANGNGMKVWLGDGAGNFGAALGGAFALVPYMLAVGDVTGDGFVDVVVPDGSAHAYVLVGNGDGTFQTQVSYTIGGSSNALALGDFNGDGKLDIISSNVSNSTATVLLNQGSGTYPTGGGINVALGASTTLINTGDLNADGKTDLVSYSTGDQNVHVYLGNGAAGFTSVDGFNGGLNPHAVFIVDATGDGKKDLAVGFAGAVVAGINVLVGKGDGTFQVPTMYATNSSPRGAASGDIDADGDLDIVVANANAPYYVSIYRNNGVGVFSAPTNLTLSNSATGVSLVDVDADNDLDIVTKIDGATGGLAIRINDGSGNFGVEQLSGSGGMAHGLAWADFNADGIMDFATGNYTSGAGDTVSILMGNAGGGYAAAVSDIIGSAGSEPFDISALDVNGDGFQDLVCALYGSSQVGILFNNGAGVFSAPVYYTPGGTATGVDGIGVADYNLDGRPDILATGETGGGIAYYSGTGTAFTAGTTVLVRGSPHDVVVADFNGDGLPDGLVNMYSQTLIAELKGAGNGTFTTSLYLTGNAPYAATVGDFNKDGHMDFAVPNASDSTLLVYTYNGCL